MNGIWFLLGGILLGGGMSLLAVEVATLYRYAPPWPQNAQTSIIYQMSRRMEAHDCAPEMEVWSQNSQGESQYLFRAQNEICQQSYYHTGWHFSDDGNQVTGFFRCELGEQIAEYALSQYRYDNNVFGDTWCQYKVLPLSEDNGVGENFDLRPADPS